MTLAEINVQQEAIKATKRLLTAADLAMLPAVLPSGPVRYELYDGDLIVMAPPGDLHGKVEARVTVLLTIFGEHPGLGEARCGEVGIQLSSAPDTVVGCDAAFLTNDQLPPDLTPQGWLITVPAVVVEVVSKNDSRSAVRRKVDRYLQAGARLVWIVDPQLRTVSVHRPGQPTEVLSESDNLTAEGILPGLAYPVSRLFA